jgi:snurportin-1
MLPDWLLSLPADLCSCWQVAPRPAGTHCLLVASHGATRCLGASGERLCPPFASSLPCGSPATREGDCATLLDCVRSADGGRFVLCDVLVWKGYSLLDCAPDFRLFWLQQKLAELPPHAPGPQLLQLPWAPACAQALAHAAQAGPACDGLLLRHLEALYTPTRGSPLLLRWRPPRAADAAFSLLLAGDGHTLLTSDEPPLAVGRLAAAGEAGRVARFEFCGEAEGAGVAEGGWGAAGRGLRAVGAGRGCADCASRVAWAAGAVGLQELLRAAAELGG